MRILAPLLVALLILGVYLAWFITCPGDHCVWPDRRAPFDSWYFVTPGIVDEAMSTWPEIGQDKIFLPADERSAIAELEKVPFKELDAGALKHWAGKPIQIPPGQHALLIRGLTFHQVAPFFVYEKDGRILVGNGTLSHKDLPMLRKPIIVIAHRIPISVYVMCSIAE
ncbi:MAG: hypothetical protein EPN97_16395 [Alphaproteobacteria bacterium]|nr:MAG: hypothetical protein EPN97_16395 [Alphaproteobacteria bacterium]